MRFPLFKAVLSVLLFGLVLEAARPICSAKNCASISKRDFASRFQRDVAIEPEDLGKRTLKKIPDDEQSITNYVVENVDALPLANKIYNDRTTKTASTSLWKPFFSSRGRQVSSFQIGLTKLTGCITVVIISNRGVYAAHFFEDTATTASSETYASKLLDSGSGKTFESIKSHFNDLNSSPAGPKSPFPQVYIVTPVKMNEEPVDSDSKQPVDTRPGSVIGYDPGEALEYLKPTQDITASIEALWTGINTIEIVKYFPLNINNALSKDMPDPSVPTDLSRITDTAAGKVLFEYDNTSNKVSVRLWVETKKEMEIIS
ncbi:hypothetical protein BDZ45DRAFT_688000 [Acephala macrosclerotiorum]|nr:hypothetical protein BDZ45DRAFT_688000 [Acephala macrosclerotiorum]